MKEIYRPIQSELTPIKSELTVQSNPSTLDVRGPRLNRGGNIFMDQGQNEQGPKSENPQFASSGELSQPTSIIQPEKIPTPPALGQPASQERIDFARNTWEQYNNGKNPTQEDLDRQKQLIEKGIPHMGGGADVLPLMDYTDSKLQNIAVEINAEVHRVGIGNPLDPIFVHEQLGRVRDLLDKGLVDEGQAHSLLRELNIWMAETETGQKTHRDKYIDLEREIIDHIQNTPNDPVEKQRLIDAIKGEVNKFPAIEAGQFPTELLELASYFKETRETLINRILFRAYEDSTETNDYRESMTLYAQSNLDTLLGFLSKADPEKYRYFVSLRTASSLFHDMNVKIIGGNLDEFISIAQKISYQHFELMKEISGAPDVMRLYEEKYIEYLRRYGRITTEGYKLLKKDVERSMRILNEKKQVKSDYTKEREGEGSWKMDEWELQRALNVGRTFFNITFRGAEQIASGQVPRKGSQGEKQYASFPQESAVKIMNWMQWMTYRFQIAEPRGGVKFLEMVKNNYKDFLRLKGRKLGVNKIKEFGGMNTDELEAGAMFGVSGIYSSWRAETMAFPVIKIRIGGNEVSIREWLDEKVPDPKNVTKQIARAELIGRVRKDGDGNQDELYEILKPLIDNSNLGIGIILKHMILSEKVGYRSRKALWERVSENNLPLMINYLSRIQFENEDKPQDRIALLRQNDATNWDEVVRQEILEDGTNLDITKWDIFSEKIFLQHHKNIKRAAGVNVDDIEDQDLDADEQRLQNLIINEGKSLAPHLADIVFPYVPFMNDVPFEYLDYAGPGEEFFKRRTGSDLTSINKGQGAFVTIMNNPGGLGHEKLLEQLDTIVKGIESPQGTRDAQERVFPMFEACINWIETKPWQRQAFLKFLAQSFRRPTSIAQKFSGPGAESVDEFQLSKMIDESVKIGILPVDLANDLKKKKNIKIFGLFWAFIRDILPISVTAAIFDLGQKTTKEKGA